MDTEPTLAMSPIDFGRLIESVHNMGRDIRDLRDETKEQTRVIGEQNKRIAELENKYSKGWGILLGVVLASGAAGAGVLELAKKLI